MKKMLKPVSCSLVAIFALSIATTSPKIGPFGVDSVSAATVAAPTAPAKPTTPVKTPVKTTTPSKSTTTVKTATPVATSVTKLLRLNSMGGEVKLLQTTLNTKGYKLVVDGIFGKLTLAAVKDYQGKNGLAVDGLVGPLTLAKLNAKVTTPVKPVTPPVVVKPVDVVTTASLVDNATAFETSIGKNGPWIISTLKDLTTTKALVLEGEIKNTKTPAVLQRKIALYTQDAEKNVTGRFTLTAPKLTVLSPNARIQGGTFKGDVYVSVANFQLVDAVVEGNVYFTTQEAKDTFKADAKSVVRGSKILTELDAVSTASLVRTEAALISAMSTTGSWIPCILNDITTKKELVLDGEFRNTKLDPVTGLGAVVRKIALYSQAVPEGGTKKVVTRRFTLTAPKLTIKSPNANITKGIFAGDLYVSAANFQLIDAKVVGNVYFTTQEAKDTFKMDATSSVTGNQILTELDAVATASIVRTEADLIKAMSTTGSWIPCIINDITTEKELVLDGEFRNTKLDPVTGLGAVVRKLALYSQDDKRVVTRKFTLTAPKLTVKSPQANITKGIFVGDIYVSASNFQLIGAKVVGNVYFTTQEAKDTFKMDATSTVSGKQELKLQ